MYNILLIDDEVPFCLATKKFLEMSGKFKVEILSNSLGSITKAGQLLPQLDLIVLDIVMPNKPGDEVAATLKTHPALQHVPTVFLTGLDKGIVRRGDLPASGHGSIGGDRYIIKDIKPADLAAALIGIIEEDRQKTNASTGRAP